MLNIDTLSTAVEQLRTLSTEINKPGHVLKSTEKRDFRKACQQVKTEAQKLRVEAQEAWLSSLKSK